MHHRAHVVIDHIEYRELAAGAVLDDLDPAERERLERHLATCPACLAVSRQLTTSRGTSRCWPRMSRRPRRSRWPSSRPSEPPVPTSITPTGRRPTRTPATGPTPRDRPPIGRPRRGGTLAPLALAAVLGVVAIGLVAQVSQLTQENAAAVAAAEDAQAQLDARDGAMAVWSPLGTRRPRSSPMRSRPRRSRSRSSSPARPSPT